MNRLQTLLRQSKVAARSSLAVVLEPAGMIQFTTLFILLIITLQWLFQPQTFWDIITSSALTFSDKLDVIIDGFFAVFQLIDDFTPISFIAIAAFQAIAVVMWLRLRHLTRSKQAKKQAVALGLGLLGSGCVACSGSVLSPLLTALATNLSISAAQAIGDFVLLFAIGFSIRAWLAVGLQYAKVAK